MMERDRRLTGSMRGQKVRVMQGLFEYIADDIYFVVGCKGSRLLCYEQRVVYRSDIMSTAYHRIIEIYSPLVVSELNHNYSTIMLPASQVQEDGKKTRLSS